MKLDIKELAAVIGVENYRSLLNKAKRENWPFEEEAKKGTPKRLYPIKSLPVALQQELASKGDSKILLGMMHLGLPDEVGAIIGLRLAELRPKPIESAIVEVPIPAHHQTKDRKLKAMGKKEWVDWYQAQKQNRKREDEIKLELAMLKQQAKDTKQSSFIPSIRSLQGWAKGLRENGINSLVPKHYLCGRKAKLNDLQMQYLKHLLAKNPSIAGAQLHKYLQVKFPELKIAESTVGNYLRQYKEENPALYLAIASPDAWKGKMMPALGTMHQGAGFNEVWEVDATIADVMCSDKVRYTILAAIEVHTRWVVAIVAPSSSAAATKALLFDAVRTLGLPKAIRHDQGSEFVNAEVGFFFEQFGVRSMPAEPYSGHQKPYIERFFKTMNHELMANMPGYTGHNPAEREKIEARLSYDKRHKLTEEEKPKALYQVSMNVQELNSALQNWLKTYRMRPHEGLKGKSPVEMLNEALAQGCRPRMPQLEQLAVILADGRSGSIGKKGIEFTMHGMLRRYSAPEMVDHLGKKVRIKFDPVDPQKIYVFAQDNQFLFMAEDRAISKREAMEMQSLAKAQFLGQAQALRAEAAYLDELEHHPQMNLMKQQLEEQKGEEEAALHRLHQQEVLLKREDLAPLPPEPAEPVALPEPEPNKYRLDYLAEYKKLEPKIQKGEPLTQKEQKIYELITKAQSVKDYINANARKKG